MSKALDKARHHFEAGNYKGATKALWDVRNGVTTGQSGEAAEMLELATAMRDRANDRLHAELDGHIAAALASLDKGKKQELLTELQAKSIAVLTDCKVIGGSGFDAEPDAHTPWQLFFLPEHVVLCGPESAHQNIRGTNWTGLRLIEIPWEDLQIDIEGAGIVRSGGGVMGGGFGLVGAAEGMLAAAVLNALTTTTKMDTVVRLQTPSAELYLHHSMQTPEALRRSLSPVFTRLRQAKPPVDASPDHVIDRLHKLADLLDRGVIDADEFVRLKADLLANS